MAFCANCGTQLPEGSAFCPGCGAATANNGANANTNAQYQQNNQYQQNAQYQQNNQYQQNVQYQNPVQPNYQSAMSPDADVQINKSIAWLSYLGILFLIPMFVKKESPYCKFHVTQGANLFVFELAYLITTEIIKAIIFAICVSNWSLFGVYSVFSTIFGLLYIFFVVIAIIGIVNAATGKKNELPLISKVKLIPNLMEKIYSAMNK